MEDGKQNWKAHSLLERSPPVYRPGGRMAIVLPQGILTTQRRIHQMLLMRQEF